MGELREHEGMRCRSCGNEERASEGYPCATCGTFICLMCVFKGVVRCLTCDMAASDPASTLVTRIDAVTPVTPAAAMADPSLVRPHIAPQAHPSVHPQAYPQAHPAVQPPPAPPQSPQSPSSAASALGGLLLPDWPDH